MNNKDFRELCVELVNKCKANGYSRQLMESIAAVAATTENMEKTIIYLCDLCDKKLNEVDYFTKAMQMAGLED